MSANVLSEKGRAISMVTYDLKSGKFLINPEAESVIKNLPSPLGVISVAGMYRTGKSYLLLFRINFFYLKLYYYICLLNLLD